MFYTLIKNDFFNQSEHAQLSVYILIYDKSDAGLQITVGHRTMTDQNLLMSDEIQTVIGHNVRTIFCAFQRKRVLF